jgi:hypothetical protein
MTRSRLSRTTSHWHELGLVGATDQSDGVSGALDVASIKHAERRIQIVKRRQRERPTEIDP